MTPTFTCNMQQQQQIASSSILMTVLILLMINVGCLQAQLSSTTFYDSTCPNALSTIRTSIRQAVSRERRMAASLVRLHFHDCFVQGCDASILLADTPSFTGERTALQNNNSARGFEVIEAAKSAVESICPGVVSCSDILAVAARDASEAVGGPTWSVNLGRRDSTTASLSLANSNLPRFTDPLATLISNFGNKGLSQRDLVALSGAHTIGQARCVTFRARIYSNGSDIDAGFASTRRRQCPQTGGNANLAPLDLVTPNSFDNNYFRNVVQQRGLLQSDQILLTGSTETIVREYSNNRSTFSSDFAAAMLRMGNIDPLTGQDGIIRTTCAAATAN